MSNVLENLIKAAGTKNSINARTDNLAMDPERFFKDVKNAKATKSTMCHKDPDYDGGGLPEFARPIEGPSAQDAAQQKIDPKGQEKGQEKGHEEGHNAAQQKIDRNGQARFLPNSSVTLIYGPPGRDFPVIALPIHPIGEVSIRVASVPMISPEIPPEVTKEAIKYPPPPITTA
ncbi:hypothetical protein EMCRGX_G009282 [Ephydatia muelleri]